MMCDGYLVGQNAITPNVPLPSSHSFICSAWCQNGMEYPLSHLGSAFLAASPLGFLCHPQLPHLGNVRGRKGLDAA